MLSDILKPSVTELGKVKIGGKGAQERTSASGAKWRAPEKYDHFVVTTLNRDGRGDLVSDKELYEALKKDGYADADGKLRRLPIAVLSNEIDDVMQCAYVWYVGKRVAARSDGKTLTVHYDHKSKQWLHEPQTKDWDASYLELKDSKGNRYFKLHTTMNFVITAAQSRWGGCYKFRTTSTITARQLYGCLVGLKQEFLALRGMPLQLVVRPMQVSPEGKTTTVYVVHCEMVGTDYLALQSRALEVAQFELKNAREFQRTQIEYRRLLSSPGEKETVLEAVEIAEEFHPEQVEGGPEGGAGEGGVDPLAAELGLVNSTDATTAAQNGDVPAAGTATVTPAAATATTAPAEQVAVDAEYEYQDNDDDSRSEGPEFSEETVVAAVPVVAATVAPAAATPAPASAAKKTRAASATAKQQATPAASAPAGNGSAKPANGTTQQAPANGITKAQTSRLNEWSQVVPMTAWSEALKATGKQLLSQLTRDEADGMIRRLQPIVDDDGVGDPFAGKSAVAQTAGAGPYGERK